MNEGAYCDDPGSSNLEEGFSLYWVKIESSLSSGINACVTAFLRSKEKG